MRVPGVLKGHDLRGGAGAVALGEEDVVVLAAVEGRVEIDEVDGLVLDVLAQDDEVVAVVELVLGRRGHLCVHPRFGKRETWGTRNSSADWEIW